MADYWKEEILVEEVPKRGNEVYRIALVQSKSDSWFISFREWFLGEDEEMRPGKGGATIPLKSAGPFISGLSKALKLGEEKE